MKNDASVSFAEYRLFCRALLQKRPVILRSLREAATRSKYEKQLPEATMGWLRLVGSLKLYVSLENMSLFCRALLQKRPIILPTTDDTDIIMSVNKREKERVLL